MTQLERTTRAVHQLTAHDVDAVLSALARYLGRVAARQYMISHTTSELVPLDEEETVNAKK